MSTCGVSKDDAKIREITKSIKLLQTEQSLTQAATLITGGFISNKKVWYDGESDTYTAYLPGVAHAVEIRVRFIEILSGHTATTMATLPQLMRYARSFKLPRNWIIKYLKVNQITHDVEPFSKEEIMSRSDDDLVEEALQIRRDPALYTKLEREKWKDIKKDAEVEKPRGLNP